MKKDKVAKSQLPRAKPKRPLSAYNFFFKEERARILAESAANNKQKSFEEIGRIIGQRWGSIEDNELAKHKESAKSDSERYRSEKKTFNKDMPNLMCSGHIGDGNLTKSGGANDLASSELPAPAMAGIQQQQAPPSGDAGLAKDSARTATAMDDQVIQLIMLHQQNPGSSIPKEAVVQLIQSQITSLAQREQRLSEEMQMIKLKRVMFKSMLAKETEVQQQQQAAAAQQGAGGASTLQGLLSLSAFSGQQMPQQHPGSAVARAGQQSYGSQLAGAPYAPVEAPIPPLQGMLGGTGISGQSPSLQSSFALPGMNDPSAQSVPGISSLGGNLMSLGGNLSNLGENLSNPVRNSSLATEDLLKQFIMGQQQP